MRGTKLRNVNVSTRSGLSSGTCEMKHVKDKRRNEGITRKLRKGKRGELRLWDHHYSCPGSSNLLVGTHSPSCNTITSGFKNSEFSQLSASWCHNVKLQVIILVIR